LAGGEARAAVNLKWLIKKSANASVSSGEKRGTGKSIGSSLTIAIKLGSSRQMGVVEI